MNNRYYREQDINNPKNFNSKLIKNYYSLIYIKIYNN